NRALYEHAVEEDNERSKQPRLTKTISPSKLTKTGPRKLFRFELHIAALHLYPMSKRLTVVMEYRRLQIFYFTFDPYALCVPVLNICCYGATIENYNRRISRTL